MVGAEVSNQMPEPRVRAEDRSQELEQRVRAGIPVAKQDRSRAGNRQVQELMQSWLNALSSCQTTPLLGGIACLLTLPTHQEV